MIGPGSAPASAARTAAPWPARRVGDRLGAGGPRGGLTLRVRRDDPGPADRRAGREHVREHRVRDRAADPAADSCRRVFPPAPANGITTVDMAQTLSGAPPPAGILRR